MLKIVPFFAIPFGFAKLDDCEGINAQLRGVCSCASKTKAHAMRTRGPSRSVTPRCSRATSSYSESTRPCVRRVKTFCFRYLLRFIGQLNNYDEPTMRAPPRPRRRLVPRHATRRLLGLHNHPMASWSSVTVWRRGGMIRTRPRADH